MSSAKNLDAKTQRLREILLSQDSLLVAYSGGVDSTLLLAVAHEVLGARCTGILADSPSLPRTSLAEALRVAKERGIPVEVVATSELEDPRYAENPPNRCYFCKAELFACMEKIARSRGVASLAYGENADDPAHLRPGSLAAAEFFILAPLREAGLSKADVRELSRRMSLPTAESPAQPCLSSRIPHGTPVTRDALGFVEKGEEILRHLGFRVFRVRYLPPDPTEPERPGAKVQVAPEEHSLLSETSQKIREALTTSGFGRIEIDPEGLRR